VRGRERASIGDGWQEQCDGQSETCSGPRQRPSNCGNVRIILGYRSLVSQHVRPLLLPILKIETDMFSMRLDLVYRRRPIDAF
jgi:hypothetical protein